jgi:CRP-like cAMP-binding protein
VKWVRELGSKRGRVVARVGRILYLGPQSQIYEEGSPVKYDGDWVYAVIYGLVEMHKAIANQKGSWSRREGSTLLGHILPGSHFGDLNVAAKQEVRYGGTVGSAAQLCTHSSWTAKCSSHVYIEIVDS